MPMIEDQVVERNLFIIFPEAKGYANNGRDTRG